MPNFQISAILISMERYFPATGQTALYGPEGARLDGKLERFSRVMDTLFTVPVLHWHFGLNAIIDLVPGFGDAATSIIAIYLIISAIRYRVPKVTLVRMAVNIGIYFIGGLLPVLGDLFDAWWKPNTRNLALLRRWATATGSDVRTLKAADRLFVGVIVIAILTLVLGSCVLTLLALHYILTQPINITLAPT
jgi:hypothetical protein